MLYEIICSEFKSHREVRPVIRFHKGLNTVLGGKAADNSVGKSTFLLIIDFVFGGDAYKASDAVNHIGNHTIKFAFKFGDNIQRFERDIVNAGEITVCDDNYNSIETIKIEDFRKRLFDFYSIELPYATFRDLVGRYMRVYGKDNYSSTRPLDAYLGEKAESAITALEKLFNVYWKIEQYRTELKRRDEIKKSYAKARKLEFLPYATTTQKQYKQNLSEIEKLQDELTALVSQTDKDISADELSHSDEASFIKGKLAALKRQRSRLKSQLEVVNVSIHGGFTQNDADLAELSAFFTKVNMRKISEIECFHGKMQRILHNELNDESHRLQLLISSLDTEISELEENQRLLGLPATIPKHFLDSYSILSRRIDELKSQNEAFDNSKAYVADAFKAKTSLNDAEEKELRAIEAALNGQMVRFNDIIYDKTRMAPVIDLVDGTKYTFITPMDSGTGTSYKSLIVLDLAVLHLTPLPALVHDSLIFNNIGYAPLEKLMGLYTESKKQIFIAFDRQEAPTEKIQKILDNTKVIQLSAGGNELFGTNWGEVK